MKYLSRVDSEKKSMHCWFVRFSKIDGAAMKSFSDNVYGSKLDSLQAAIEYRDKLIEKHHNLLFQPVKHDYKNPFKSNKLKKLGISINIDKRNSKYSAYRAQMCRKEIKLNKSFSWSKYGKEDALNLAIQARKNMEEYFKLKVKSEKN